MMVIVVIHNNYFVVKGLPLKYFKNLISLKTILAHIEFALYASLEHILYTLIE